MALKSAKGNSFMWYVKCTVVGLITGFANGIFGSGGGTVVVPAMTHLLGVEEHKAHATAIAVILPLTILSTVIYVTNGHTDWPLTLKVTIGGIAGGYIGASILKSISTSALRKIFGLFLILAALRMLAL